MSDHATRLTLWFNQGQRYCMYCDRKVYMATDPGGGQSLQHVDPGIQAEPHMAVG